MHIFKAKVLKSTKIMLNELELVIWFLQWLGSASISARSNDSFIRVMQMSSLVSETANQKGGNYSLMCPKPC